MLIVQVCGKKKLCADNLEYLLKICLLYPTVFLSQNSSCTVLMIFVVLVGFLSVRSANSSSGYDT